MYLIVVLALQQFGGSFQNRLKSYIPAKIESLLIKTQQHVLLLLSRPLIFVVALILFGSSGMPVVLKLAVIAICKRSNLENTGFPLDCFDCVSQ
ncbi:MAG: hypothetical protein A3F17_02045 [Gammaproteobacteria bacterium RIFCSPHIGHO2_12_FULL_41_15]|nr:MAG: hypothetical protein A3F17_02045 [Gammaproteobacteria bacterium RIFCSPHIGHO2_12_FULL_41_15]